MRLLHGCMILIASGLLAGCVTNGGHGAPVATGFWSSDDLPRDGQYKVLGGDTLYTLARRFDIPVKDIIAYNHLKAPYTLFPGQTILLKPSVSAYRGNPSRAIAREGIQNVISEPKIMDKKGETKSAPVMHQLEAFVDSIEDARIEWGRPSGNQILKTFSKQHEAVDYAGHAGDPVHSASDGEVIYSGSQLQGYGNLLIIKHNNNFLTAYAHNRTLAVQEGDNVKKGQIIAEMGQSGSDHVHLHFEMRYKGEPIDPTRYLQGS